jgi:hypothetical protein
MVLFYDYLDTFLDPGQNRVNIAREFRFCDANRHPVFDHTDYFALVRRIRLLPPGTAQPRLDSQVDQKLPNPA